MHKSQLSIKWKIFLYLLGFCGLLLVVLWLFQTVFLESFYKIIKQNEVQSVARSVAQAVEAGEEYWESYIVERGDIYVELWSEQGGPQTVEGNRPQGFITEISPPEKHRLLEQAIENGGEATVVIDSGDLPELPFFGGRQGGFDRQQDRQNMVCAIVLEAAGGQQLLLVSAEITPVGATVATLRRQLIYISVLFVVVALVLALLIARKVSGPIQKLNKAAARLGEGKYDIEFSGKGYSEVEQLADTLNHASGELAKTEALRRELVANVSHDLRTPLTLITGYAEMMRDIPGENTAENMQVIIEESKRLTGLVADLMDLSRLQSGTGEIHLNRINLTKTVTEILDRFTKLAEAEGFDFSFLHTTDAFVQADEPRIAQVIYNFLANAMAHTGPDKRITVRQKREGGRVRIEVADTGPGIPAELLPVIWERYYRVDTEEQRASAGAGLGLSIAKSILEQHPGVQYGVHSRAGEGSVFWFSMAEE